MPKDSDTSWLWRCTIDEICALWLWLCQGEQMYESAARAVIAKYT